MLKISILALFSFALAAQRPGTRRGNRPQKIKTGQTEVQPQTSTRADDPEMAAVRALQVKARATYADACRIVLLQRGEFARYTTDGDRCARVHELGILKTSGIKDIYSENLTLGAAAKTAINAHGLQKSLMFRLTGWSWYALQNAEGLGLIADGLSASDGITGGELMNLMDEALAQADEVKNWNAEENPYKEFGYDTYEEMYNNPVGPAKINRK
jgi:hypothetical protein